ncbi:MAG: 2-C-methyl-D-erythritol 2,4-cyclodiphosphate synthase [Gammaproteobacteria bacterium]|nr:2-C-methyl-D-erythritol 2,4-cyclodiphosphate synthase [Gammaproteobacteria bacterium]MCW8909557.1 2-C-methyl-D-erythritol 2,4-cyclodiphosphate synthase [Gammaproteobacteria bacterium]MCW9003983.1 2-C-methyl-D-erythritol 2,4-cyclodiphosphate synthase [Gammaproteobacteria bacterium]MCW9055691.1 2-C-methyl-D-erythritol 2,4-cyclodiphosphate synthase [Gammaproteobacteria bacterium]
MTDIRIGHGYDVHAFEAGDSIILGGVRIPHTQAFKAHSDGDVLIHALCDALLGALALGDIGTHFPDTDEQYKNANSRDLLKQVMNLLIGKAYFISNVDATIIAQTPKLQPYISDMKANLSQDLNISQQQINIKATTTEKLGFTGREEGISAHVVVLIKDNKQK